MTDVPLYLKPNVVFEPLIDGWYAWSHLISPATAAMHIYHRHLAIMESFLSAPDVHIQAVKNPKMRGGPFMNVSIDQVAAVQNLYDYTIHKRADSIEFCKQVRLLDSMLLKLANGASLELLYDQIPGALKGFVELLYDRQNNPAFRFYETLLYESNLYDPASQSIALWITNNDERPFVLSTPRLYDKTSLLINRPFAFSGYDELSKMRRSPQKLNYIKEIFETLPGEEHMFEDLFTESPFPQYAPYSGGKVRIRYFGHACILLETDEISILVDPLISYYGYHSDVEHYSDSDLPDFIDYVLITHNHQDHILFETLIPLRHKIGTMIVPATYGGRLEDPNLKLMFDRLGFANVVEIGEMQSIRIGEINITGIPFMGEHSDLNILTKMCHLVSIKSFKCLFMADSRILNVDVYRKVQLIIGEVNVLFLGMECDGAPLSWLYGPLVAAKLTREQDNSRRLNGSNCKMGLEIIEVFKPKEVYVYAMGQEPWVEFISSIKYTDQSNPIIQSNQLIQICRERGIVAERLYGEKELSYVI